jgi:hypothetical protein
MKLFKKYEFNSKEQAQEKIEGLGVKIDDISGEQVPTHSHAVVELGYLTIKEAVIEVKEDGDVDVIEEAVLSDKYSVDVLFDDLDESPYGWKTYEIDVEGNGVHTFSGYNFNE